MSLSLVILDIDHFKEVNDTHGHLVGDSVLQKMVLTIDSHTRKSDFFARWGGEEFVLLLVGTSQKDAMTFAENIRLIISNVKFDRVENVSCSFGVSSYKKSDTIDTMIKRADDALYLAKNSGRNNVKTVEG
jgi:diguanylate cyclase (GGDEF)-like protein